MFFEHLQHCLLQLLLLEGPGCRARGHKQALQPRIMASSATGHRVIYCRTLNYMTLA